MADQKVTGYAASERGGLLKASEYTLPELRPDEVQVEVSWCGICHSDIHLLDDDWKITAYPFVPGHEIIGTVVKSGNKVSLVQPGMRVGIGWQRSSCLQCEWCRQGEEHLCSQNEGVCVGHPGGFGQRVQVQERFAIPIPEALDQEQSAPLFCGGVTVFSPLRRLGASSGTRVGIIGIGGLGHLAIQFAKALGADVTAFSTSPEKEQEALDFGASRFVSSKRTGSLERLNSHFDFLLSTVPASLDWPAYLNLLRPNGRLCLVGVGSEPVHFPSFSVIGGQKHVSGSVIGSPRMIAEMLEVAARHHIGAQIQKEPLARANEALAKVRNNQARYRMVLAVGS